MGREILKKITNMNKGLLSAEKKISVTMRLTVILAVVRLVCAF